VIQLSAQCTQSKRSACFLSLPSIGCKKAGSVLRVTLTTSVSKELSTAGRCSTGCSLDAVNPFNPAEHAHNLSDPQTRHVDGHQALLGTHSMSDDMFALVPTTYFRPSTTVIPHFLVRPSLVQYVLPGFLN
jgi:hypothetical protein